MLLFSKNTSPSMWSPRKKLVTSCNFFYFLTINRKLSSFHVFIPFYCTEIPTGYSSYIEPNRIIHGVLLQIALNAKEYSKTEDRWLSNGILN